MRYTTFGNTGRKVSVVGLGGAQFGIYNEKITKESGAKIVRRAYDSGINYFDTAPWYGYNSGQSEMTLGEGFRGLDRSSFMVATKIGRYDREILTMFDFSAEKTEASVKRSLEYLQTGYIDVIQIHDFEYAENINQILTETLPALERLRQRGLVKHIGLGTYNLPKTKYVIENSPVKIDSVLNHSCITLIDQELREYAPFLKERGIALVNASPLAHGLLIDGPIPAWLNQADPDLVASSRRAIEACKNDGFKIERLAIGYSAQEGEKLGVNVLLTGADTDEILDANIDVICNGLTAPEQGECDKLHQTYFADLKVKNWGNADVISFFKKLKEARENKPVSWV